MSKRKTGYDVDGMLPFVGEFARFQYVMEAMLCISIIPQTLQVLIMYFAAQNPGWRCASNSTVCNTNTTYTVGSSGYELRCDMARKEWEFVQPKDFSIVTQFDLYCDTEIYAYFTTSFFFIAWCVGAVVLGLFADWFGRKKVLFPSLAVLILVGFVSIFSPNFWVFLTTRIIIGFFDSGANVQMFVMASEFVGNKHRPLAGILLWFFFALALVMLGVKAYFIRKWKMLFIVCTAPYIFTVGFAAFIPESIRWLNLNGKHTEAMKILHRIAKFNKKEIPDDVTLNTATVSTKDRSNPLDLFRTKKMAISSMVQAFGWLVGSMVYNGLTLAADDLGGKMYRDYIISSLVEFPAVILSIYLCDKIGRKRTVVLPMFFASVLCILVAFIPTDKGTGLLVFRIICGMMGKLCASISFDSICTWSIEIYPTVIRSQGMGLLYIASALGAAGAPWVAKYLNVVHRYVPFAVMGGVSLISTFILLYLPETKDVSTAETLEPKEDIRESRFDKEMELSAANDNLGFSKTVDTTEL